MIFSTISFLHRIDGVFTMNTMIFPALRGAFLRFGVMIPLALSSVIFLTSSASNLPQSAWKQASSHQTDPPLFPYKKFGLTERQAAAYLLDRFAFGARPGDIDAVVQKGLEGWFEEQLQGKLPEPDVQSRLATFSTLAISNQEIVKTFPNAGFILRQAIEDGVISGDVTKGDAKGDKEYRVTLLQYAKKQGYRPKRELFGEMYAQKLLRAVQSPNQLREVLTDFWFNHFNVSITDNQADQFVMTYERDAIRPNVTTTFRALLGATAKHPAMLAYLDNAQSTAPDGTPTRMSLTLDTMRTTPGLKGAIQRRIIDSGAAKTARLRDSLTEKLPAELQPRKGINENYARELMELHTLGVDGGYSQKDVTEAARILTGWTIYPMGPRAERFRARFLDRPERAKNLGFVQEGDFLFRADAHDATAKTVLGEAFPAGGGIEEGEKLLDMLAKHPSTATFICTKLAARFVSDTPPPILVSRMSATFLATNGDIQAVLRTLAASEEFWNAGLTPKPSPQAITNPVKAKTPAPKKRPNTAQISQQAGSSAPATSTLIPPSRSKIKSPFELAVSALRAMNAEVVRPREVLEWIRKIGQPLYSYQAPTGFPDRAEAWINTGALLGRMNFGLNLALGNVGGVKFDLAALNNNHEPQSLDDALETYARLLLPERNVSETVRLLKPVLADPAFAEKVSAEAQKTGDMPQPNTLRPNERKSERHGNDEMGLEDEMHGGAVKPEQIEKTTPAVKGSALAQVVGLIVGSPEFQRR